MAEEINNPVPTNAVVQVSAQTNAQRNEPLAVALAPENQMKKDLSSFFSEATKYTVLALFILYAVGFLIWHSFLATYYVSSIGFLQIEYLSGALCYFLIVICFATPPAILIERILTNDKTHAISYLIYVWYLVSLQIMGMFFPDSSGSKISMWYLIIGTSILIIILIINFKLPKKYTGTNAYKLFIKIDYYSIYLLGYIILFVALNKDVNKVFVIFTILLYLLLTHLSGKDIRKIWQSSGYKLRLLLLTMMGLLLMANVELFGVSQFGKIPRQVGGGKPEVAYVKFNKEHEDVPLSLGIPICTNSIISDQFCGPVDLLLRTDKELIFLIANEANSPLIITNEIITSTPTNFVFSRVTNNVFSFTTNQNGVITPFLSQNIVVNVVTNILIANQQIHENVTKMTAKQVRADLVESVIFSR